MIKAAFWTKAQSLVLLSLVQSAELSGSTDTDADKSATLGGYRLCQVKPRAAAYKSHPFILLIL